MLKPQEGRDLKKNTKRLFIFLPIIFVFDAFIAFLLFYYTKVHNVLCGFIIIVITGLLYLLFLYICAKIDKKREKRLEKNNKKDPFTRGE